MLNNIQQFKEVFGCDATTLSQSPGRLEVLGNHTDYNEGFVLSIAVDCNTKISFSKRKDKQCCIYSPAIGDGIREFTLNSISEPLPNKDWTNYVRGVLCEMQKRDLAISGFNALITSTVPLSAGMSSSASLEMALVGGLEKLFNLSISIKDKALIGQGCENNYIGANTGLMDQLTSLAGQKNQLVLSEYRDVTVKTIEMPAGLAMVVFHTKVAHDLSNEYNERREQCEEATALIRSKESSVSSLRDVDLEMLEKYKPELNELAYLRALHVVGENTRVLSGCDFLDKNDLQSFGKLLFESHESSQNNFENSCKELDVLIKLAKESGCCLGARLSGGGFGGISIHLVKEEDAETYSKDICKKYQAETGKDVDTFICCSADGTSTTSLL